jgi:hypothetical protein
VLTVIVVNFAAIVGQCWFGRVLLLKNLVYIKIFPDIIKDVITVHQNVKKNEEKKKMKNRYRRYRNFKHCMLVSVIHSFNLHKNFRLTMQMISNES